MPKEIQVGDYYETIVDVEATADDAGALAARVRDWLIAEGVVRAELTDCVLGGDGRGHTPGANWRHSASKSSDEVIAACCTSGIPVVMGQAVYHTKCGPTRTSSPGCAGRLWLRHTDWFDFSSSYT